MIDYRYDPKASTGGFELIYRQVIPPAPAYLGLNLFLKGTQMLKHGRKEKGKDSARPRSDVRPSTDYNSSNILANKDSDSLVDATGSRPFIVDFINCINTRSELKCTPRKSTKLRALISTRSTTKRLAKESVNGESPRSKGLSGTATVATTIRQSNTIAQRDVTRRKSIPIAKAVEPSRRHVSCGPRLVTASANNIVPTLGPDDAVTEDSTRLFYDVDINNNKNTELKLAEHMELACIGNKCGTDNNESATGNTDIPIVSNNSRRKQSQEVTPRTAISKPKLKPINVFNGTSPKMFALTAAAALTAAPIPIISNINSPNFSGIKYIQSNTNAPLPVTNVGTPINVNKSVQKFLSANNREYRKYVNHFQISKLQPKSAMNDSYCSHFYTVGLSLRAWRSKYNQILKKQNEKVELSQSYGPISSRKPKRLGSKTEESKT